MGGCTRGLVDLDQAAGKQGQIREGRGGVAHRLKLTGHGCFGVSAGSRCDCGCAGLRAGQGHPCMGGTGDSLRWRGRLLMAQGVIAWFFGHGRGHLFGDGKAQRERLYLGRASIGLRVTPSARSVTPSKRSTNILRMGITGLAFVSFHGFAHVRTIGDLSSGEMQMAAGDNFALVVLNRIPAKDHVASCQNMAWLAATHLGGGGGALDPEFRVVTDLL